MIICLACCRTITSPEASASSKEKNLLFEAVLTPCCQASICASCVQNNPRLAEYCPRCQVRYSDDPSQTPFSPAPPPYDSSPPAYAFSTRPPQPPPNSKEAGCIHYLRQSDSLSKLSLMYKVSVPEIRRANNLFGNDNLIHARHFILIPGYHGPSLSNEPEETEEVEMRKLALKRFQLVSKCVDYKMATIYMESSNWDIELAAEKYKDDLDWEKSHPRKEGRQMTRHSRR